MGSEPVKVGSSVPVPVPDGVLSGVTSVSDVVELERVTVGPTVELPEGLRVGKLVEVVEDSDADPDAELLLPETVEELPVTDDEVPLETVEDVPEDVPVLLVALLEVDTDVQL